MDQADAKGSIPRRRRLRTLAVTGLLLMTAAGVWRGAMFKRDATPPGPPPRPIPPKPNGYDDFVAATRLLVGDKDLHFPLAGSGGADRHTFAQHLALIEANRPALARLRAGFRHAYQEPQRPPSFDESLDLYARFVDLARDLRLESGRKAFEGDWYGAMESRMDALRLGTEIPKGAIVYGMFHGHSCMVLGLVGARPLVDRLDAAQALRAAAELGEIQAHLQPYLLTLDEHQRWGEAAFRDWISDQEKYAGKGSKESGGSWSRLTASLRLRGDLSSFTHTMNRYRARARLPYADFAPMPQPPPDWLTTYTLMFLPNFRAAWVDSLDAHVRVDLLRLSLILRAYSLKTGTYPRRLSALVPTYLDRVPTDPFSDQTRYRYRLEKDGYALYSVGPDAKDDGGLSILNEKGRGTFGRYLVTEKSRGDIVAGVNP